RFVILNPCSKRWPDLTGDSRKGFCADCQSYIHDVEQYSDAEIDGLRRTSPGRLCGYLSDEAIVQPRSRRAILVGAMLTAISPLMAQSGRVRIRATDASGVVRPEAKASILGQDGKPGLTTHANEQGEIVFGDLPIGNSKITVASQGFSRRDIVVTIRNAEDVRFDVELTAAPIEILPVGPAPDLRAEPRDKDLTFPADPPAASPSKKKRRHWWNPR